MGFVPPSSLIFLVILAVWAAYLVQHWVRRRDHIATARSVDRFSEAMRVLERRQRGPRVDVTAPTPRSYAVSPARPGSPDVVVKRATGSGAASGSGAVQVVGRSGGQPTPVRALGSPLSSASGRATTLLLASLAMLVGTALGVLQIWPPWTVAAGVGVFVLALWLVRHSVRRGVAASLGPIHRLTPAPASPGSRPSPGARRPGSHATRRRVAHVGGAAAALAANRAGAEPTVTPGPPASQSVPAARPPKGSTVYDIDQVEQQHTRVAPQRPSRRSQPQPGARSWAPVPVPAPTYTLKAKASAPHTRPEAPPAPPAHELPFDGYALAFDEEFEDLPAVHSLG